MNGSAGSGHIYSLIHRAKTPIGLGRLAEGLVASPCSTLSAREDDAQDTIGGLKSSCITYLLDIPLISCFSCHSI